MTRNLCQEANHTSTMSSLFEPPSPAEMQARAAAKRNQEIVESWPARMRDAFANPLVGKPHTLPAAIIALFGKNTDRVQALACWFVLAREPNGGVEMPGEEFFRILPEIIQSYALGRGRKRARSAAGRWDCFRGMLKTFRREGQKDPKLEKALEDFVDRMLPLTLPVATKLPLSKLVHQAAKKGKHQELSKALVASATEFLHGPKATIEQALALCHLARKQGQDGVAVRDGLDGTTVRHALTDGTPGMKQMAMVALRGELEAQRQEHIKCSSHRSEPRYVLRRFLRDLGSKQLAMKADESWSFLDEPTLDQELKDERSAWGAARTAKHRLKQK